MPALATLQLYPLNALNSWAPKSIALTTVPTKIGRQTCDNDDKVAVPENGFFDSKVMSRQHAEVWVEGGKIFIKDTKSSNGTYVNGDRLSAEGVESKPAELKAGDVLEFGINVYNKVTGAMEHPKIAARVVCAVDI